MLAKSQDLARTGRGSLQRLLRHDWAGAAAGLAGLLLVLAVELASTPAGRPTVRYSPPFRSGNGAIADWSPSTFVSPSAVDGLRVAFERAGYDIEDTRRAGVPVPRLRLAMLPRDLPDVVDIEQRKTLFLSLLLPLVLEANARIALDRQRLRHAIDLRANGQPVPQELMDWVAALANRYEVSPGRLDELLLRVDIVPPSLVLAQAAAESGWGTSRFAIEGNAIFGQWTTAERKGLVPRDRPEGETYKIRSFERLIDSVNAYLLNLNTHRSYRGFRMERGKMRQSAKSPDGRLLAGKLRRYSQTGDEYVELLQDIIRKNRLRPFDRARLGRAAIEPSRGI